jgi:hypothetical protein
MMWLFRNWRTIALIVALVGVWHVRGVYDDAAALKATVAAQDAALREADRKAQIVRKYHAEKDMIDDALDAKALAISQMEGGDAPLSDYLRNAAGQLWP